MAESATVGVPDGDRRQGVLAYFARNPVAANVLLFLLFVGGLIATDLITLETFPAYDPRIIRVEVPYPAATPSEVEEDIVKRIEESLVGTIGVARTISSSREELAVVDVEMEPFADDIDTLNFVRTAIERIEDFPPLNSDEPEVTKLEVSRNVLTVAVSSGALDPYRLRGAAEGLRDRLLLLPSVSIIDLFGTRDQEIQVELSEETLRQYGITLDHVVTAIRGTSVNVTGGELRTGSGDIIMSTLAKRDYAEEFADVVVLARADGSLVRLGDIARLRDSLLEHDAVTTVNGVPTIFLQVKVSSDTSPQEASAQVREYLAGFEAPETVGVAVWEDETWAVEDRMYLIIKNGVFGLILVFAALLLLFDLRIATWVALGVPVVFVASLIVFPFLGLTLNVITLFAFFILIGLVVDDAIVVGENIATHRSRGETGAEAAIAGTREVIAPITVGALTTMAAFAALLPLDGLIGQMFAVIPIVVVVVLLLSLFEAAIVLPGHLAGARRWSVWPLAALQERCHAAIQATIEARVVPLISWSVRRQPWPPVIVAGSVLVAAGLLVFGVVRFDPGLRVVDEKNVQVDLVLSQDARPEDLQAATDHAVAAADRVNAELGGRVIDATATAIGHHFALESYRGADAEPYRGHLASVQLRLNPPDVRGVTIEELKHRWRLHLADIPGVESLSFPTRQAQTTNTLSYALMHPDPDVLAEAAGELREALTRLDGVGRVSDTIERGKRRFDVRLNAAGHAVGLTAASVATQLRNGFYGAEAQRIQRGREEVLVMVRYPQDRRTSYAELLNERINLPASREQVPLYTVAEITETRSVANRLRIDGRSAAVVTADYDATRFLTADLADAVEERVLPGLESRYPDIRIRTHGVNREIDRLIDILALSVPIALLVMYCLIASFLRCFVQPLLALAGIPMAFVGAVVGHLVLGYEFSSTSVFGLLAVSGVVVNDTILLMYRYNQMVRESGIPEIAAVSAATRQRARAILLTSVTTLVGLLPILFSGDETIQFLIPLVVSVAFGLVFAGIGLLFFLPSVIMLVELAKGRLIRRRFAG
ncbi:MAG: efflux RND transporter permease subunit [Gammaproteobacteria bacterium]|nr:efflux RND transporter permease subunit [Gammaproteobacteria bacterium]